MALWDSSTIKPIYYDKQDQVALTDEGWVDIVTGEILVAMQNPYQRKDDNVSNMEFEDGENILLDIPGEIQTGFLDTEE